MTTQIGSGDPDSYDAWSAADPDALEVDGLSVSYGGRAAVQNLSLRAPLGAATALIGPNGAGKTSTLNACSGLTRIGGGQVSLRGRQITRMSASRRARLGLGRTFQRAELCERLTVTENVVLGADALAAGRSLGGHLRIPVARRRAIASDTATALELCGLTDVPDTAVNLLSTGRRRLVELARAIACRFEIILLDEPSAGLDTNETRVVGNILRGLIDQTGLGLLLVEHDMSLVRALCDFVYVLDFGELLYAGPTDEALGSETVKRAYLGIEASDA
jgi:ABC-type branched-subunit amino acid transport system ATPase component